MTLQDQLQIEATHGELRRIGPWLTGLLGPLDVDETVGVKIELAVHELALNSVDHSEATTVTLIGAIDDRALVIELRDRGCSFDPAAVSRPTEPQVRGYGLMIIEQIATSVDYHRIGDENRWTVQFCLEP